MFHQKVCGNLLGTGAILKVACGFLPDRVRVVNITNAKLPEIEWNRFLVDSTVVGGIKRIQLHATDATDTTKSPAKLAAAAGISLYNGGDILTAASTSIFIPDPKSDKRETGTLGSITKWTLGNLTNRTGNFNAGVNTTDVGVGSRITVGNPLAVDGKLSATIVAITNDGDAANEITLDVALPTGLVLGLTGKCNFIPATPNANLPTILVPQGFQLAADTDVNVSTNILFFEAERWS